VKPSRTWRRSPVAISGSSRDRPYVVVWLHELIERQIASFVVQAVEQGHAVTDITTAMERIDRALSIRPHEAGESREGFERVLFARPLVVHYEIHEEERVVVVRRARYAPKPRPGA
jgi:hypothetical protein